MKELGDNASKLAALVVSVTSAGFVIALLWYLFHSANLQNGHFVQYGKGIATTNCQTQLCLFVQLESDLQQMRSARVGYALIYRFSISAAAIVVSLATVILGSVLVFDRIQSAQQNKVNLNVSEYKVLIQSTWPGLIMVFLGSFTLVVAIALAGPLSPKVTVLDTPVFLEDLNTFRNLSGGAAGVSITSTDSVASALKGAQVPQPSLFTETPQETE